VRIRRERRGFTVAIGGWQARLNWGSGSFGWHENDGRITRRVRKFWSGWHRWDEG